MKNADVRCYARSIMQSRAMRGMGDVSVTRHKHFRILKTLFAGLCPVP